MSEKEIDIVLEIKNLKKHFRSYWLYRPLKAVENVSLQVRRNEAFGFLGHNGAGKTTTIKCIVGLIHKSFGEIFLNGKPLQSSAQHQAIGYLPEHPYFYDHLSVKETLTFFTALYGIQKKLVPDLLDKTLSRVGLDHKTNSPVRALSKGLQQRLGIAQAIIHDPELLILDEPFSGLDPIGRKDIRELILSLKESGTTIFMSSHILSDVEDICDRVSILSKGEVKSTFNISDIPEKFGKEFQIQVSNFNPEVEPDGAIFSSAESTKVESLSTGKLYTLKFSEQSQADQALEELIKSKSRVENFRSSGASLEDIFMEVTGEEYKPEKRHSIDSKITN